MPCSFHPIGLNSEGVSAGGMACGWSKEEAEEEEESKESEKEKAWRAPCPPRGELKRYFSKSRALEGRQGVTRLSCSAFGPIGSRGRRPSGA